MGCYPHVSGTVGTGCKPTRPRQPLEFNSSIPVVELHPISKCWEWPKLARENTNSKKYDNNGQAWQCYVCDQLTHALKRRSAWLLFGLSFGVVYREVFETILFYAAIWNQGNGGAVLAGGATTGLALVATAGVPLRYGQVLPIGRFFAYSSGLITLLAVVLTGKGVAASQEAGYLPVHPMADFPELNSSVCSRCARESSIRW